MNRDRFDEGLSIDDFLGRVVARAAEWRDAFERAQVPSLDVAPADLVAAVLAEDWSWECAVGLPAILRFLSQARGLATRVFPRDLNLDLACELDREDPLAIPRIALFDSFGALVARWGPRAVSAERVFREKEAIRGKSERVTRLRAWYETDRGRAGVDEVHEMVARAMMREARTT
ncbi:MAG: thioredoxin family protein [Planctomycetes bacterium]|nr:thioredoxin family protein [Planctomycetota bacterium]MBI3847738.1 thioredoxin family protein [Planctomycetota bacterium]